MKNYSKFLLAVMCAVFTTTSYAQQIDTRQKLYATLPETINVDKELFTSVLEAPIGKEVSLQFSNGFNFTGTVLSNFTKYGNMHTVMVRSNENTPVVFQVTGVQTEKGISYSGRIISSTSADGFEIKNDNGTYSLQKFETLKVLDPCNL